jgi:hypothetical protein
LRPRNPPHGCLNDWRFNAEHFCDAIFNSHAGSSYDLAV